MGRKRLGGGGIGGLKTDLVSRKGEGAYAVCGEAKGALYVADSIATRVEIEMIQKVYEEQDERSMGEFEMEWRVEAVEWRLGRKTGGGKEEEEEKNEERKDVKVLESRPALYEKIFFSVGLAGAKKKQPKIC